MMQYHKQGTLTEEIDLLTILRLEVNPGICGVPVFWGFSSPLVFG